MNGLPGMRGVKVVTGAAIAVLLLAAVGPGARSGRYDRGRAGARPTKTIPSSTRSVRMVRSTDENVPQALSGYRPQGRR